MEFFNKKEEVLEIKLTPFGMYRLAQGQFSPEYYSFFDTDILYDSQYAASGGFAENQNDAQNRISLDTTSIKPLKMNSGVSSSQTPIDQTLRGAIADAGLQRGLASGIPAMVPLFAIPPDLYNSASINYPSDNFLDRPIGTSKLTSKYLPSWDVKMLQGLITGSSEIYTGSLSSAGVTSSIPQINITYDCGYYVSEVEGYVPTEDEDYYFTEPTDANNLQAITTNIFPDGTYITVDRKDLVISLEENNADFFK